MSKDTSFEGIFKAKLRDNNAPFSEDDYKRFCNQLKASFAVGVLNLSGQRIGINVLTKLSKLLRANQQITAFNFYGNLIRDHGIHSLLQLLMVNTRVKVLDIGCNDFTNQAVPTIVDIINNTKITSLQIGTVGVAWHNNKFTIPALSDIVRAVQGSNRIECLGLSGLCMSFRVGARKISMDADLAHFIEESSTLKSLSIAENGFAPKEQEVVLNGLLQNENLKFLDMHISPLPDPFGGNFLSQINRMSRLSYLDLHKCQLSENAGASLAESLKYNTSLIVLDISENEIGDLGFMAISQALLENYTLSELNVGNNNITEQSADHISELILKNNILSNLDLSKNGIGDVGAHAIAASITNNESLTKLNISSCRISDNYAVEIAIALKDNKALRVLKLSDNFLTRECGYSILEEIRANEVIFTIDVSATQIDHFVQQAINTLCQRNKQIQREVNLQPLKKELVQLSIQRTKMPEAESKLKSLKDTRRQLETDVIDTQAEIANTYQASEQKLTELNKLISIEKEMTQEEYKAAKKNEEEREVMKSQLETQIQDIKNSTAREEVLTEKLLQDTEALKEEIQKETQQQQEEEMELQRKIDQVMKILEETKEKVQDEESIRNFVPPQIDFSQFTSDPIFLVDKIEELKEAENKSATSSRKRKKSPKKSSRKKSPKKSKSKSKAAEKLSK
ncbi:Leucine Rich Repeat family protein [Trichomonas vaginalis G3]|uniref:Leucine Rich Repeat family protein n=1 Tax=Trichomonas vaginalis (strain ATCC PRA-98 / G3) TaxID=412133 RepID=A2E9A4_TRIV3|nr:uncharacterized protein TVAGG3_0421260 [Trichomonas vaginalis G3]EAY10789.1 Leucine Rich Repeat family protein [Trichomonas vaginalis G3]KAI5536071.1 interleukin-8 biosynthetic process [Trichomonas vaginalis G3]|eukprot:XP_001323012.1 hypothetical protein [Trichomonas vaginalis G3]